MRLAISIDRERIAEFCRKWRVKELSIFGSALGEDFRPDSDVDVLVVFGEGAEWDLFDHLHAGEELRLLFARDADPVEKQAIRNPFRRHHILNHREVIYAT